MTHETPEETARQRPDCRHGSRRVTTRPKPGYRRIVRLAAIGLALMAAAAAGALLPGCGSGIANSFSGGGVPIGGSRVAGRVVSAANTSVNLPNVAIQIDATPLGGVTHTMQTTSSADGSFAFSNVLPGFSSGSLVVTATPSDSTFQAEQLAFNVQNGHTEQMILTLPPASFDNTKANSVALFLAAPAIPSGTSIQVQSAVRDSAGNVLPVKPTLVFDGNFGSLDPDGVFTVPAGTLSGTGSITAFWYRLPPQTQQIRVDNNAPLPPPNPPVLPGSPIGSE
ncbi:MAG TPA: hypothetical protein VKT77_15280 [Chthonomonadaceae bacterium]|nr:hypothetical protein [Chthonomonadaceae bacterium]